MDNINEYDSVDYDKDINHFTALSTKRKKGWYIPVGKFYYNKLISINDNKNDEFLNAANGLYSDEIKDKFLKLINAKKYTDEIKDLDVLDELDLVAPITRRIIGEFIRQPDDNYSCIVKDADATLTLNSIIKAKVNEILMAKLMEKLQQIEQEQQKQQGGQQGEQQQNPLANVDIEEEIQKIKTAFFEDEAEKSKALVDSMVERTRLKDALIQQFYYLYATESVYTVIEAEENNLTLKHISPADYYRYPSSKISSVEDDIAGMYKYKLSYYEFKDEFKDKLSKSDFEYITEMYEYNTDSKSSATILLKNHLIDYGNIDIDKNSLIDNVDSLFDKSAPITIYKLFIRTKRKYLIISRMLPDGSTDEIIVDETYKLNTDAGDISKEELWKDEIMEMYICGDIEKGVYTKPEPLKFQREFLDNVATVKIPVVGASGLLVDYLHKPIPYRLIPLNIIYKFLHIKIQSEIAKFQGFINIMPESILTDSEHFSLNERLDYLFESNLLLFDDSQVSSVSLQAIRTIGNYQKEYINQLKEIKEGIKADAWEVADMNNERYGDIDTRGGQGNTREAIIRVSTGTLLLFSTFDIYLEKLYQAIADYSRLINVDGYAMEYKDKNGNVVNMNLNHDVLMNRELGIFFKKSQIEREKIDAIKQNVVQAAMQNNEFLLGIEAIDADNVFTVKKIAKKIDESNKEREKYFKELDNQIENAKIQREKEKDANEYKLKVDVENIKGKFGLLEKDKDLLIKMIEFSSFNPNNNKYEDDINILSNEIEQAELDLKRSQKHLVDAKIAETHKKTKEIGKATK